MFTVFPMALQKVLHTILIVVNCNLIIMLVCTFVGVVDRLHVVRAHAYVRVCVCVCVC